MWSDVVMCWNSNETFILNSAIINVSLIAFYLCCSFSRDLLSFSSSQLCETGSDPPVRRGAELFPPLGRNVPSSTSFSCQSPTFILKKVQIFLIREKLGFSSLFAKYTNMPHFDCLEFFMRYYKDLPWELLNSLLSLESCIMCHGFCLLICDTLALTDFAAEYSLLIILRNCCLKNPTNFSSI